MSENLILGFKDSMVAFVIIGGLLLVFIPISNSLNSSYNNSLAQFISNFAPVGLLFILVVFIWSRLGGGGYE